MSNKSMNAVWRPIGLASLIVGIASLPACTPSQPPAPLPGAAASAVSQEHKVVGFEPDGEPVIRLMKDGSIRIVFEAMPPDFAEQAGTEADFAEFENVISKKIGTPVIREDRKVFVIRDAPPGTGERLREWLATFHDHGK